MLSSENIIILWGVMALAGYEIFRYLSWMSIMLLGTGAITPAFVQIPR